MPLKKFIIEYPEDSDISPEKICRYLTTDQHISPGVRVTIFEVSGHKEEFVNCSKCGNVLSIVRHPIRDFICKDCT